MKRKGRKRIFIAWLLLLALMPISIVKATHSHDTGAFSSHNTQLPGHQHNGGDDGSTCPICHFFLSPFTTAPEIHVSFFTQQVSLLMVPACPDVKSAIVLQPSLRAPPCAFIF